MKTTAIKLCLCGLVAIAVITSGCGMDKKVDSKNFYLLDVNKSQPQSTSLEAGYVKIRKPGIAQAFSSKDMVYRLSKTRYESDYYNRFFTSPADMVAQQTKNWFADSKLFKGVVENSSSVKPDYILESHIEKLYGDFTDASKPVAVMQIRYVLIAYPQRDIAYDKLYCAAFELSAKNPDCLVQAYNSCLTQILTDFENDLATAIQK